jgi:sulfatase modifying factor 1
MSAVRAFCARITTAIVVALGLPVALVSWPASRAGAADEPSGTLSAASCGAAPFQMSCIPGGYFLRGSDHGLRNARPQQRIWVDTFYMDQTEVTVEAYAACVGAGACRAARTVYEDFSRPLQPKVGVSWYDAVRFCRAHGKHLPTEAEWEKAACGTDGRVYPWGNETATCRQAVIKDRRGRSCGVTKRGASRDKGRTFVVATRPANQYGLYDMSGNAWEWVYDWYSPSYQACGQSCRGPNPRGPCRGQEPCPGRFYRVVRGGSWYYGPELATCAYRHWHIPTNQPYHHFGFRCAASLQEAASLSLAESRTSSPPRSASGDD